MSIATFAKARTVLLDICAIAGGITGVISAYAVFSPETVGTYLEKVTASMNRLAEGVDVIAQSVPLWPLIDRFEVEFAPPSQATIGFSLSNPKNLLVEDFRAAATLVLDSGSREIALIAPTVIPPNDRIIASANIIREDWFIEALKTRDATLRVCFSGQLEAAPWQSGPQDRIFSERRTYSVTLETGSTLLIERTFASGESEECI